MNNRVSVLVVENEAMIRMAIVSELQHAGFEVFEAHNADAAISMMIFNSSIEVIFTDIDMPGSINGLKLAAAVRDGWAPVRIIVTSGYPHIEMHVLPAEGRFLRKPYDTRAVAEVIRDMMAA
ncbi:response regulator [Rhizobium sp. VS19-DR104.2]|uniref:response regulator n=1 Tax=unclassified Rhizobium TaxID=2613769 RepID=UPI001CC7F0C4|nr:MULTISPECIES: response regulator [unclassified Rhizobium]MBZ5762322.1 response regulator [Rhizobium sp. VS19-DR96]MBZ5768973.1 response regulator [Rhizobium sp. VS19-DR129.2]MBZ5775902.1 response regulator [Rhizobium sp. VS19-DRK62.2]MBZ5786334.1 response regulator [Rhizobium sp. VS19-DR121]MBZ5804328.1 response regulator [Rhizobium sp. VS19-DR181]